MFETDKENEGGTSHKRERFNWASLPVSELVKQRDAITRQLPPLELGKMNMEEELLLQFHTIRSLQSEVLDDETIAVNQRAQVANTVAASLKTLSELQIALYSSERFKAVERLLVRTLNKLPEDLAAEFLVEYERLLEVESGK